MKCLYLLVLILSVALVQATEFLVKVALDDWMRFEPETLRIRPGDTVVWQFRAMHTLRQQNSLGDCEYNDGLININAIDPGNKSMAFTVPGTYYYFCVGFCSCFNQSHR